jgi:YHS domain-containing protein
MIRTVVYLLVSIFLITLLRYVIGMIGRAFSGLLQPTGAAGTGRKSAAAQQQGGELKRDPVCGTYVPAATSPSKTVRGELVYFCSQRCKDKYQ